MFAREADSNEAIAAALEGAVFLKIDCEKGEGPEVAAKYGVRAYPTFMAVNADGEITDRWLGFDGAEQWGAAVEAAKADPRTMTAKKQAYEKEPTASLAASLANDAACDFDFRTAVDRFKIAREMNPAGAEYFTEQILTNMYYGSDGGDFTFAEIAAEVDRTLAYPDVTLEDRVSLASMVSRMAGNLDARDQAIPYIKSALEAAEGNTDENLERDLKGLRIDHALLVEKDEAKAVALRKEMLPEGWQDDPRQINRFAWWCFENKVNLAEAQELAVRGVELAADDQQRAQILDTAAEICAALGNCDQALTHIKRALELQPDSDYYKEQLAKFEAKAAEAKG